MPFARPKKREPVGEAGLFEYAVASLARRPRTVRDLSRLMRPRAQEGEAGQQAIDAVIARLIELNYLSDTRFAADFTRLRKENEKFGRRRVQQDLAARGVPHELAGAALGEAYDGIDEVALARQFCERKRIQRPADQKDSARTMGRLLRAGFSPGTVFKVLRQWGAPLDDLPDEIAAGFEPD